MIERIGTGWETGELTVTQEHFATECLSSFLTSKWRQLNNRKSEWTVLMGTLPGETHNLGLLMSTVVASLSHAKVIYLGLDTPLEGLIETANIHEPELLCLSISWLFIEKPVETENHLLQVRKELSNKIQIISGGKGTPKNITGITRMENFNDFNKWLVDFENRLETSN